jgi:streptogramin lyase
VAGKVHGGQAPVVGATVQLYDAGNSGNGSAATAMLSTPAMTDLNGNFAITSGYSCNTPSDQVYIVATGGNPGLGGSQTNPALVMMAVLGNCSNLAQTQSVDIDEVTTVVAAWTLAPFISSYSSIGASATNATGLTNAFLNAQLIADTSQGVVATLPSNLTTETGKIYALADALAPCVNSNGSDGSCASLFADATPSGGSAPTNTFAAAVDVVKNPGNNVPAIFSLINAQAPFPTTLTQAPNDWTLSLTVTGGGVAIPQALGFDAEGSVWVADFNGLLSAFGPQGTPLSTTGYGAGTLSEDFGLTVDPSGNVWVSVEESPGHGSTKGSVVRFLGVSSGGNMGESTVFSDNSIDFPFRIASDSSGNILIANNGNSSVDVLNPTAGTYTTYQDENNIPFPVAVAPDGSGGIWVAAEGSDLGATHISGGVVGAGQDCCGPANGVAVDSSGNVWVSDYLETTGNIDDDTDDGSVSELGTAPQDFITAGGVFVPSDIVVDSAQNVWITNYRPQPSANSASFTELAGSASSSPGSGISPATGYGLDADLVEPYALAIDASGNVWISNQGKNDLVMFFGMAAPVKTPRTPLPTAP